MLGRLKAEISARLRPVCQHMDEAMFDELVDKIAENERRALKRGQHWSSDAPPRGE